MQAEQKTYKNQHHCVDEWKLWPENFGWMNINQYTYAKYNWSVSINDMINGAFFPYCRTQYDERQTAIIWKRRIRKFCYYKFKCMYKRMYGRAQFCSYSVNHHHRRRQVSCIYVLYKRRDSFTFHAWNSRNFCRKMNSCKPEQSANQFACALQWQLNAIRNETRWMYAQ